MRTTLDIEKNVLAAAKGHAAVARLLLTAKGNVEAVAKVETRV